MHYETDLELVLQEIIARWDVPGLAYARWAEIKSREDEFYCGEDELLDLALQLLSAGEIDLAIEVLKLNLHVYPEHTASRLQLAKYCQRKGISCEPESPH